MPKPPQQPTPLEQIGMLLEGIRDDLKRVAERVVHLDQKMDQRIQQLEEKINQRFTLVELLSQQGGFVWTV